MKRLFTLIVAMCSIIAAMAQHPMATVSHNGELTQFTGVHALDAAMNAVEVGDVIYLSEGDFLSDSLEKVLRYGVRIVGSGYNSRILLKLSLWPSDESATYSENASMPILDGVYVKELGFDSNFSSFYTIKYLEIRNCWIGHCEFQLNAAENFNINRCFIEDINFYNYDYTKEVHINNSKIVRLGDYSQYIQVKNCNILKAQDCPRILLNSIISGAAHDGGKFVGGGITSVYNSLLPSEDILNEGQIINTLHDCYIENPTNGLLDENLNATIDLQAKGYLGQDGTIIGAYGGDNPFSELPSVPSIDSEKSSVEYDADSKKLNVTITVAKD